MADGGCKNGSRRLERQPHDKIIAFFQFRQQRRNIRRIILPVAIHHNHDFTVSISETRRNGGRLTKISFEPDHPKMGLAADADRRAR